MALITFREALNQALAEEMERDDQVFLMGEEVGQYHGAYKVSQGLMERFGEHRVIDSPITENSFVGLGVGAAHVGMRPVIEVMTYNFAMLSLDQMVNNAAKLRYMSGGQFSVPMVLRGPNGAGGSLAAQHSQAFEQQYVHIPGLKVIMPSTPADAKGLLKAAIRDPDPVIFMESEKLYNYKGEVPETADHVLPIGVGEVKHTGSDVTIVTYGRMYTHAVLPAIERLEAEEGISVEVVDPRTLRPLDLDTILKSVAKTNRMVLVEESWPQASVGAWICEQVYANGFDLLDAPIERLSHLDVPMPYARNLEDEIIPSPASVVEAVKKVCYR
jgi:pyruvate dehydrogenase E1 component beta subunit